MTYLSSYKEYECHLHFFPILLGLNYMNQCSISDFLLCNWINAKKQHADFDEVTDDLEQVEGIQAKLDDFQTDLKANEVRLAEMNEIAVQLTQLGLEESALKITAQIENVNEQWQELTKATTDKVTAFERAHEVQRFQRDVEETKDWIQEKDEALSIDDLGKDLRSVQALQRKHEGLERDLAALGDKIHQLNESANKLSKLHPDSSIDIYNKQTEINEEWTQLNSKASLRKEKLLDSFDLQRFNSDYRDLMSWISSMKGLIESDELAVDVTGAEALLERHQVKNKPLHLCMICISPIIFRNTEQKLTLVQALSKLSSFLANSCSKLTTMRPWMFKRNWDPCWMHVKI